MIQLFYNQLSGKLFVSEQIKSDSALIMRPFEKETDKQNNKSYSCDIEIPDSQFRFKINTQYKNGIYGSLKLSLNGKALIKMSDLMHVLRNRKLSTLDKMSEILISLSSEDNDKEWESVFEIIKNAFNNLATWQANEALIMIDELKKLMAENESYELTWNKKDLQPRIYSGLELTILKAQKLMEAIKMLKVTEMDNLVGTKEDICDMCVQILPMLKSCYLSELNNNEQLLADLNDAKKQLEFAENASKDKEKYVEYMLDNKYSNTSENAEIKFTKRNPNKASLIDSYNDISTFYSDKKSKWETICEYRSTIEEAISTIIDYLRNKDCFDKFLNAI